MERRDETYSNTADSTVAAPVLEVSAASAPLEADVSVRSRGGVAHLSGTLGNGGYRSEISDRGSSVPLANWVFEGEEAMPDVGRDAGTGLLGNEAAGAVRLR